MATPSDNQNLQLVTLVAPLQTTESGSGTFLGLASDGNQYWIKAPNNPQGVRTLAAEVVVHGIGALIGAPVCRTALVNIPISMNSLNWWFTPQHKLTGGIGHGSLNVDSVIVSDEWTTYSARDNNRARQAQVFALWDLCMGGDPQWLHDTSDDYSIWTFDHGFWLGGDGDWSSESLKRVRTSPWQYDLDPSVASAAALRDAATAVDALDRDAIRSVTQSVPIEWGIPSSDLSILADMLYLRTDGVAKRLATAAKNSSYD
ncbi:hypothetical protein QN345_00180 [Cryobacterium sp. 10I1]|uniref:hypothetical protein n=1 Tax=unclassified Cryobacterium TaxID=2649013 RepID=UPI002AC9457A|nr:MULTISPECIES: hypothetical protein [unclassified Cryobacterium]MEB0286784.1 hypothetical protein [Cryobacterium sp. 10S3]MEB0303755.1 hypothetical protein [Cryobacterium sp. 10I1]WPX12666.1 hypothetical protein RHM57_13400 [Cryobacterium sp. 10S3]